MNPRVLISLKHFLFGFRLISQAGRSNQDENAVFASEDSTKVRRTSKGGENRQHK